MKFFTNGIITVCLAVSFQNQQVVSGFVVRTPSLSGRSSGDARSSLPAICFAHPLQQRSRSARYPCQRGGRWKMSAAEEGTGAQASGDSNNGSSNNGDALHEGDEGELGQASLASLVEKTFVMAAAGSSYQEGLKAFITVCKEAYERGYTVPALTMEVSFVPTKTAGRDLYEDEVELRSIWVALVYLTLENAHWPQKVQRAHEISAPFMDRFAEFVKKVMNAAAKGHTLQTLKLEEVMRKGMEPRTPLEQAVLSQSMRIVFATLDLMKEGWTG